MQAQEQSRAHEHLVQACEQMVRSSGQLQTYEQTVQALEQSVQTHGQWLQASESTVPGSG